MKLIIENWKRFIKESNDVSTIIKDLLKNSSCSVEEINNGQCEGFMMDLIGKLPEDAIERTVPFDSELPGHYWVEFRGKHYDAETPDGVDDWRELPIFQNFLQDKENLIESYVGDWAKHSTLNLGQVIRHLRYFFDLPDTPKLEAAKERARFILNDLVYAMLPPQTHHTPEEIEEITGYSYRELLRLGFDPDYKSP